MADIIDLMLATGARIGEILAVRWVDVALDATRHDAKWSSVSDELERLRTPPDRRPDGWFRGSR